MAAVLIDLQHLGRSRVIASYLLAGDEPALVDCGPTTCLGALEEGLAGQGLAVEDLRHLVLTHIHLDHAGAAGALVRRNPELQVHVSEIGAPHLVDPSRLEASARRLYADDFDRLWGELVPVPEENVHVVGGDVLGLEAWPTPGHASHHVSYLSEDGTCYSGDVTGVVIAPSTLIAPVCPPPDVDLEAWERSLDSIAERKPERLCLPALRSRRGAGRAHRAHPRAAADLGGAGPRRGERGGVRSCGRAGAGNGDRSRDRRGLHAGGAALAVLRGTRSLLRQEGGSGGRTSRYPVTRMRRSVLGVLVAMLVVVFPAAAGAAVHTQLVGNFDTPIQVFAPRSVPGSTLYVVEKGGKIIRRQSGGHRNVVLDIHGRVSSGGEQGLLSAVIADRKLFVYYTNRDGDSRVVRYTLNSGLGHVQSGSRTRSCGSTSRSTTTTAARSSSAAAISTSASATAATVATRRRAPRTSIRSSASSSATTRTAGRSSATGCATPGAGRSTA